MNENVGWVPKKEMEPFETQRGLQLSISREIPSTNTDSKTYLHEVENQITYETTSLY